MAPLRKNKYLIALVCMLTDFTRWLLLGFAVDKEKTLFTLHSLSAGIFVCVCVRERNNLCEPLTFYFKLDSFANHGKQMLVLILKLFLSLNLH